MPLNRYPFSERYGWIQDKYRLCRQLTLSDVSGKDRPFITPSLLFEGDVCGKALEIGNGFLLIFRNTKRGIIARDLHGMDSMDSDAVGTIMFTEFMLKNQWFAAMDSAREQNIAFNEAISFVVFCDAQEEIDYYWEKLSSFPEAEQCGWLKDEYGLSWQIVARILDRMMQDQDPERLDRVTQAFLKMKKFDLAVLQRAYEGK
jgi:predicted 3-demethylubiquinone-9 3-methyltransferase (glyoxalase superfamily)